MTSLAARAPRYQESEDAQVGKDARGAIVLVTALFVGPAFCGWICPFGSIQEWIGKIGRKLSGRRFNRFIPAAVDRYLRYLRYAVLIWVVYVTARSGELVFEAYDPYYALFNFWSGEVAPRRS